MNKKFKITELDYANKIDQIKVAILGFSPEFITFEQQLNIVMPDLTRLTEEKDNDVRTLLV